MRDTTQLTRRRWLAACGGAAAVGLAGCLGGDSTGDGGDSGRSDGGSGGGDQTSSGDDSGSVQPADIPGQLDVEETVSEHTEWKYTLEPGDTLTATFDGDENATPTIYQGDSTVIVDSDRITADEELAIINVTADETQMYRVDIRPSSPVDVKIYLDSA